LIQIINKEKTDFRNEWHTKQNKICPLLKKEIPYDNIALDHKHKRKKDPVGPNGDGLIRGVVQMQANALEGKIINNFKRLGLEKYINIVAFLRNLADYLENPPIPQIYIHPNEIKRPRKLAKNWVKKINKMHKKKYPRRKNLTYPKSKKLTKQLEMLSEEFNCEPIYLKE